MSKIDYKGSRRLKLAHIVPLRELENKKKSLLWVDKLEKVAPFAILDRPGS